MSSFRNAVRLGDVASFTRPRRSKASSADESRLFLYEEDPELAAENGATGRVLACRLRLNK
jgi:hypothetical protein